MRPCLFVVFVSLLLSSCATLPPTVVAPTRTRSANTATATFAPATTVVSPLATPPAEYLDRELCFAITPPAGWNSDLIPGTLAAFFPGRDDDFMIVRAGTPETLQVGLYNVKQGSLGRSIQEVKDFSVDNRPALWVRFAPGADMNYQFLVIVFTPCGDGKNALYISARGPVDREMFEMFLRHIRFLREQ